MFKVFVYGTLKKGFCNHHFLEKSRFLGKAETLNKYALYLKDYYPFVTEYEKISIIKGEVYQINQQQLQQIDILEEVPDYYYRKLIKVKLIDSSKITDAFIYFNNIEKGILIKSGEFLFNYKEEE